MNNIIIGTAGHIDHGKTTLIKALTGRETDTLEEEKKRGISINLGFTYFDLPSNKRAGIIDVPGHEKFIKNMLAGASGIDIVLLVVACDEGVMPQTIEHIDILSFLNIKNGIVVLTKSKSVDEELKYIVKEDVKEKIKDTFLKNSPIIEVDSILGYGIDTLISIIDKMSDTIEEKHIDYPPRLNIDRVFSSKGFGTIVTGTLLEGTLSIDNELEIYPQKIKTKIRSIQVHDKSVNTAYAGQRVAINISNLKVEDIKRGDVLAAINSLEKSMMLDVKISLVSHTNRELKHWDRLKLYHGTKEILCRAVPLDKEAIKSNDSGYVQLRLENDIVAKKGDKFVIRTYSPMETIGGGIVIDTCVKKHKRFDKDVIESLKIKEKGDSKDIILEYLKQNKDLYISIDDLMSYTGFYKDDIEKDIQILIESNEVIALNKIYLSKMQYEKLKQDIFILLSDYHKKNRLKIGISKDEIRSKIDHRLKNKDIDLLLDNILNENIIKITNNLISLNEFKVILNDKQKKIKIDIENKLKKNNLNSIFTIDEICKKDYSYREVIEYMIGDYLKLLDNNYIVHISDYENAKLKVISYIKENGSITIGEFRDLINSNRKNSLIILEDFDKCKITKRIDDKRVLF